LYFRFALLSVEVFLKNFYLEFFCGNVSLRGKTIWRKKFFQKTQGSKVKGKMKNILVDK